MQSSPDCPEIAEFITLLDISIRDSLEILNKSVDLLLSPLLVLLCKDLKGFIYHTIMVQFNFVLVVFLWDNLACPPCLVYNEF